jgi:hypothetical protein
MAEKSILEMVLPDPVLSSLELPLRARRVDLRVGRCRAAGA